jgi:hypothetical protein
VSECLPSGAEREAGAWCGGNLGLGRTAQLSCSIPESEQDVREHQRRIPSTGGGRVGGLQPGKGKR